MRELPLTRGYVALVDDEDFEVLSREKWRAQVVFGKWVYASSVTYGLLHRHLLGAPRGLHVDHIDGNGLNNSRGNLRLCNRFQNQANRRRVSSLAGYKGVTFNPARRKPWRAKIQHCKWLVHLGWFSTAEEAAHAYDAAAVGLCGEFAATNELLGLYEKPPVGGHPTEGSVVEAA